MTARVEYMIKNASCGGCVDSDVLACYEENIDLVGATTDAEAIEMADALQDKHDAEAKKLLENGSERSNIDDQFMYVPCYLNHIVKRTYDEIGDWIDEDVIV